MLRACQDTTHLEYLSLFPSYDAQVCRFEVLLVLDDLQGPLVNEVPPADGLVAAAQVTEQREHVCKGEVRTIRTSST